MLLTLNLKYINYIDGEELFILKSYFFTFYPTLFYRTFVVDGIVLY